MTAITLKDVKCFFYRKDDGSEVQVRVLGFYLSANRTYQFIAVPEDLAAKFTFDYLPDMSTTSLQSFIDMHALAHDSWTMAQAAEKLRSLKAHPPDNNLAAILVAQYTQGLVDNNPRFVKRTMPCPPNALVSPPLYQNPK